MTYNKLIEVLRPNNNSLRGSEVNYDLLKDRVVKSRPIFYLQPKIVVTKQNSSFQNWQVSHIKTIFDLKAVDTIGSYS